MTKRFQFSLKRLFRWTTCIALILGAVLFVSRMANNTPSDPAIGALWLALAITAIGAALGAFFDDSLARGLLVGGGYGLTLVTVIMLALIPRFL